MLFLILLVLFLCSVPVYFKLKTHNYWKKKNVLRIGDLMANFICSNDSMPEICKQVYDGHNTQHVGTTLGTIPTLILRNLEDVQAVLAGDFLSFHSRGIITNPNDILADNLLFTNDFKKWKLVRQKLSPVFTSSKLKNMFSIIEKCAQDFVDFVEDNPHLRKKPFNVLYTYTTASIGASVFGIDTQSRSAMESPFLNMAWKSLEPTRYVNFVVFISNFFPKLFKLLKLKIFGEHEEFFVGTVKAVLESRRHAPRGRNDFIDICLELQSHGIMQDFSTGYELSPTDELLAAQAFFFFIAGADTTANAIHFSLLELSNNPKILARVHTEVDDLMKDSDVLNCNDMEKLPYLDMVINEALRKYPPIGLIQRLCTKDTVLPSGVSIEKDTVVIIPVYGIHRDEKYFPDPDLFDPERFAPHNVTNIKKYSYLPFGEGNRICIGSRFARYQIKAALTLLLRRFTLTEQTFSPKFDKSPFGLRSPLTTYELKLRDVD